MSGIDFISYTFRLGLRVYGSEDSGLWVSRYS